MDGDLAVPLDPGDRIDDDLTAHDVSPQRPNRAPAVSGTRPSSRSTSAW
jgi:hypothetical protein